MSRRSRGFDPRYVPTVPVELDRSHPLALGLVALYIPFSAQGAIDFTGFGAPMVPSNFSNGGYVGGSAYGPGLGQSPSIANPGVVQAQMSAPVSPMAQTCNSSGTILISGTFFATEVGSQYPQIGGFASTTNSCSIQSATGVSPVQYVGAAPSGNSFTITSAASPFNAVIGMDWLSTGSTNGILNGVYSGSQYGGTIGFLSSSLVSLGGGNASNGLVVEHLAVWNFQGIDFLWACAEPFAMLRPTRRRTYFVPASAPSSNIGASLVATSSLSASLRGIGAIRASAAATSQVTSSLKGVGTVGASLAGISQVSASTLGAGKLGADLLATSALSASTRGIGTISAHLAATSSLSSAWFILPNIGASLAATSALSVSFVGAFPILPGRSISVLPSIRFIVAPVPIPIPGLQFRVPTFSPRAPNDVDFFTVDLGETGSSLIGTPAVTVPTGDLTIAGVTVSGSQVTFTVSGPGTPAAYSQLAIAWQTGNGAFSQTFQVLTNGFVAAIPVNSPAGILLPAPFFGSRATGDVSYFQLDMTGIVPAGAAITSAMVSCPTGDMTVGAVLWTATSVAWEGSGAGTIGQASGFAVQVAISTGAQLTFFAAIETMAPP